MRVIDQDQSRGILEGRREREHICPALYNTGWGTFVRRYMRTPAPITGASVNIAILQCNTTFLYS